jgi:hypothetical protein
MRTEVPAKMGTGETRAVIPALSLCVAIAVLGTSAGAANGSPTTADLLAGYTLSAVTWVPRPATVPGAER